MLWLALRFASLPLEVFTRAADALIPLAVADSALDGLVACNEAARNRGVTPGMRVAAATALAHDLRIVTRDTTAEEAALERIAAWAIQFTPAVSLAQSDAHLDAHLSELLLEIEGSLTIFRGLKHLWSEIAE